MSGTGLNFQLISTQPPASWSTYTKAAIVGGIGVGVLSVSGLALAALFHSSAASVLHATALHQSLLGRCVGFGALALGSSLVVAGVGIAWKAQQSKQALEQRSLNLHQFLHQDQRRFHAAPAVSLVPIQQHDLDTKNSFETKLRTLSAQPMHRDVQDAIEKLRFVTTDLAEICSSDPRILNEIYSNAEAELDELEKISNALETSSEKAVQARTELADIDLTHRMTQAAQSNDIRALDALTNRENVNLHLKVLIKGTILHYIAKKGSPIEAVRMLAAKGADFNAVDRWGNTPLLWALANAQNSMAMELIAVGQRHGLNPDIKDNLAHRNAALHLAVGKGYVDQDSGGKRLAFSNAQVAESLIRAGADVNIQNAHGNTPLHLAYLRRDQAMVARLKEAGAREDILNAKGERPAQMASKSYEEASALLYETVSVFLLQRRLFQHS